jgi:hypothetical protein
MHSSLSDSIMSCTICRYIKVCIVSCYTYQEEQLPNTQKGSSSERRYQDTYSHGGGQRPEGLDSKGLRTADAYCSLASGIRLAQREAVSNIRPPLNRAQQNLVPERCMPSMAHTKGNTHRYIPSMPKSGEQPERSSIMEADTKAVSRRDMKMRTPQMKETGT